MAGGEELNAVLDSMDQEMLDTYNEYANECVEAWETFKGNNGQMVIVHKHLLPAAAEHALNARPDWPESDKPDDYLEAMYAAYDSDVVQHAFGETLQDIYASLVEWWEEASNVQYEHAQLAGPDNAGPHSTHPVWRG